MLELGEFGRIDGQRVLATAHEVGLRVEAEKQSTASHLCINRTRNLALIIEDGVEAERMAAEMIAAGVPVVELELD